MNLSTLYLLNVNLSRFFSLFLSVCLCMLKLDIKSESTNSHLVHVLPSIIGGARLNFSPFFYTQKVRKAELTCVLLFAFLALQFLILCARILLPCESKMNGKTDLGPSYSQHETL